MAHIYMKANNTSTNCYFYPYVNSSTQKKVNLLHCSCYQTTRKELFNMAKENKFLKSPAENLSCTQQVGSSKSQHETPSQAKGSHGYEVFQPPGHLKHRQKSTAFPECFSTAPGPTYSGGKS